MKEETGRMEFVLSDAWLLLAMLYCCQQNGKVLMENLVATADYIDHSIPTYQEVNDAIYYLIKSGNLDFREGDYYLTDKVLSYYNNASTKRSYLHKELERIKTYLAVGKTDSAKARETVLKEVFSQELYRFHVDKYLNK